MIDFNEEIKKYSPILGVDEIENSIQNDDIKDIIDILSQLTKEIKNDAN